MFSAQSLLAGNGTTLNVAIYVTPLVVRNFWLLRASHLYKGFYGIKYFILKSSDVSFKSNFMWKQKGLLWLLF